MAAKLALPPDGSYDVIALVAEMARLSGYQQPSTIGQIITAACAE
jgi:hypothetical protein